MRTFLQLLMICCFTTVTTAQSDFQITYVNPIADEVTITNVGNTITSAEFFWITSSTSATNIIDENHIFYPGDHYTVNIALDNAADYVILTNFGPPPTSQELTYSYMQYGAGNQLHADQAVAYGLWDSADSFVDKNPSFVTETGKSAAAWLSCSDAGVQASNLQFPDFELEKDVCVSSTEPVFVELDVVGTPVGTTQKYLLVDASTFEILSIQDLTEANEVNVQMEGVASMRIYQISYISQVSGLREGDLLFDLEGCFDLSTSVRVHLDRVSAMTGTFDDGTGLVTYCANGIHSFNEPVDVNFAFGENIGDLETWVLVNLDTGLIIDIPTGAPFLFDELDYTTAQLHYLRHNNPLTGVELGAYFDAIEGCYAEGFSDYIFERNILEAGTLSEPSAIDNVIEVCGADDIVFFEFGLEGNSPSFSQRFIDVDQETGIVYDSHNGPDFGLTIEEIPEITDIYSMTYVSPLSFEEYIGVNVNEINACYKLSNPITIVKVSAEDCGLGIDNGQLQDHFILSPRITKDIVQITSATQDGQSSLTVYNLLGQEIQRISLNNSRTEISTKNWDNGLYIFRIEDKSSDRAFTTKIIKR